jgi:NAD(P)-dependent dehydrogenase (short-subunit alcohol dehydrogenase family)
MSTDRTAVVTGASSGIGRATLTAVRRLRRELRSSSLGHTEWREPLPEGASPGDEGRRRSH